MPAAQGGRKSSDGAGAAVGGVALAAAQAIAAGKKVAPASAGAAIALPVRSNKALSITCCDCPKYGGASSISQLRTVCLLSQAVVDTERKVLCADVDLNAHRRRR